MNGSDGLFSSELFHAGLLPEGVANTISALTAGAQSCLSAGLGLASQLVSGVLARLPNGFEMVLIATAAAGVAVALLPFLAWLRLRAVEREMTKLESLFRAYGEASMRIGDALTRDGAESVPSGRAETSRRAVLQRARLEFDAGRSAEQTADRLGLRRDERLLMRAAQRANEAA